MPIAFPRRAVSDPARMKSTYATLSARKSCRRAARERRVELAESPILEDEPPREPAAQLRRRLECSDAALLRPEEREGAGDGVDDVCGLGDVGRPDHVEPRPVDPADRRHTCQVLGRGRLGSRARTEDEDDRGHDSRRQDGTGRGQKRAPTSQRSHARLSSSKRRFRMALPPRSRRPTSRVNAALRPPRPGLPLEPDRRPAARPRGRRGTRPPRWRCPTEPSGRRPAGRSTRPLRPRSRAGPGG